METRKNPRLREYDYSANGAYFVTVCSENKRHIFGSVVGAGHPAGPYVELSSIGKIVDKNIQAIPKVYPHVFVDAHAVMPNHIHLILRIDNPCERAGQCPAPTVSLPKILSALKSLSTREAGRASGSADTMNMSAVTTMTTSPAANTFSITPPSGQRMNIIFEFTAR